MIDWTKLRTKFGLQKAYEKFEQLALMYVSDVYPQYEWEATPQKGDGNRDIQLIQKKDMGYDIWAEAKYRNSSKKQKDELRALERKDIDSTILSGLLHGKVRLIIFISNARLPNKVMDRAMLGARIRGIEVTAVLSTQLENWQKKKPERYQKIFEEELHADPAEIIMGERGCILLFIPSCNSKKIVGVEGIGRVIIHIVGQENRKKFGIFLFVQEIINLHHADIIFLIIGACLQGGGKSLKLTSLDLVHTGCVHIFAACCEHQQYKGEKKQCDMGILFHIQ